MILLNLHKVQEIFKVKLYQDEKKVDNDSLNLN